MVISIVLICNQLFIGQGTYMSYTVLENQMKNIINGLSAGTNFRLRDIINDPPALLGRRLYEGVQSGEIPNVIYDKKVDGVESYTKI